jgi:DNA-binding response OmpR family regulator
MLPGKDGEKIVEGIRTHSYLPIIIISGKVEVEDKVRLLRMGVDDYN